MIIKQPPQNIIRVLIFVVCFIAAMSLAAVYSQRKTGASSDAVGITIPVISDTSNVGKEIKIPIPFDIDKNEEYKDSNTEGTGTNAKHNNTYLLNEVPQPPGTIVTVTGDLVMPDEAIIFSPNDGKVLSLQVAVGDRVEKNQTLGYVSTGNMRNPIRCSIDGAVLAVSCKVGDIVNVRSEIYVIGDISKPVVETFVSERYANFLKLGQTAEIKFSNFIGEKFTGVIYEISNSGDFITKRQRIRLQIVETDGRLRIGMLVLVTFIQAYRRN